jgi:hypothetical protein
MVTGRTGQRSGRFKARAAGAAQPSTSAGIRLRVIQTHQTDYRDPAALHIQRHILRVPPFPLWVTLVIYGLFAGCLLIP